MNNNYVDNSEMTSIHDEAEKIFPHEDVRAKILELLDIGTTLSQKEQVIGMRPKFIIPGWIGLIQESSFENKLKIFDNQKVYKDNNYITVGTVIVENTKDIVKSLMSYYNKNEMNSSSLTNRECVSAINVILNVRDIWVSFCPERALYHYIKVDDNHLASLAGIMYDDTNSELSKIGFNISDYHSSKQSFWNDAKEQSVNCLYQILGYIINVLTLGGIMALFSAIF